ncbi:MAG: hypothetical protein ACRDID_03355, partial [Ktedonobacterales bacterium]
MSSVQNTPTGNEPPAGAEPPAGSATLESATTGRPHGWRLYIPSHLSGVILAAIGYIIGAGIAGLMATDEDGAIADQKLLWGFIGLTLGWLIGVGALNFMFR